MEAFHQFTVAAVVGPDVPHELHERCQLFREQKSWSIHAVLHQFPCAALLGELQEQFPILNVPPSADECRAGETPLILIQHEHRVHRTTDARGAGEFVQRVAVTLLAQVVYQEQRDIQVISQLFHLLHFSVVVGVGEFRVAAPHHLG